MNAHRVIVNVIATLLLKAAFSFVLSAPVMLLWNACLVPAASGLHEIGWLQAWGLVFLVGLLFESEVKATFK